MRFRAVDRRSRGDQGQASEEAKDRPQGCSTSAQADDGKELPANLGTEPGESRFATTVVAPASLGADAHADNESVAGVGHERGLSLEEKTVQRTGARTVREAHVGSLGQSTPTRVVGVAGPHESNDCRADGRRRAGSQKATRGSATDDPSRCWSAYGPRLRADHRNSDSVCSWQADRHLRGDDSE